MVKDVLGKVITIDYSGHNLIISYSHRVDVLSVTYRPALEKGSDQLIVYREMNRTIVYNMVSQSADRNLLWGTAGSNQHNLNLYLVTILLSPGGHQILFLSLNMNINFILFEVEKLIKVASNKLESKELNLTTLKYNSL